MDGRYQPRGMMNEMVRPGRLIKEEIKSTGTYYNKNTATYELWVVDDKNKYLVGTISELVPKELRQLAENEMWTNVINQMRCKT